MNGSDEWYQCYVEDHRHRLLVIIFIHSWIFWANSEWPWPYHILNTLTQFWLVLPYSECTYRILIGLTLFWMRIPFSEYSEPILIDHGLTIFWILLPHSDWSYPIVNILTLFRLVLPYSECTYHVHLSFLAWSQTSCRSGSYWMTMVFSMNDPWGVGPLTA